MLRRFLRWIWRAWRGEQLAQGSYEVAARRRRAKFQERVQEARRKRGLDKEV